MAFHRLPFSVWSDMNLNLFCPRGDYVHHCEYIEEHTQAEAPTIL